MSKDVLPDLRSLIEFASANAEKLFRRQGRLLPMYHAIATNGEHKILTPSLSDKDLAVAMVKAWFVIENIDRYVFIDEAWIVDARGGGPELDVEKARRYGISNHPDRREIVMFAAENHREMLTARRFILRPEIGKPSLSPLVIDEQFDHSEGRMVGLLSKEK
jgi:hypothetical protein